ncbi:lantibiotic protection ABC transporter ATP-binding protein [Blautia sp.]|jgi:gallidermin-class lantibiotic protection ABC transporter ATP-binding subunit|uniref:Putative ABC transporter ATP-binding protein YxlF n=1 Tax=Blautia glucerasea TaxID=536633 RepID=A0A6N2UF81_9FIRM|nr:lantibiotic protection ABC transporter ATP-binding protein [uncultured Blautia sp.]
MSQNIIEIKNLEKSFKHHKVIRNISMSVPEGSVYGLLGPNGAGKSTILKMLTGLLRPDSGRILFCGTPWTRKNLEETGSLIETPPVYENLSAWENLKVRALILGETEERIKEVLEMVNLTDTGKKPAGKFSLGMKQRLGIAIALLGHPRLLILDEPVNGLDPLGIQEIRGLIRSFADQGMTVMISSHILSEIQQTADHIGILVNGKMGYEGPVTEDMNLESLFMKIAAAEREVG